MPMAAAMAAAPDAHQDIDDDLLSVQSRCTAHINSVSKIDIIECKSLNSPPPALHEPVKAVGVLLGEDWSDWQKCKKGMKNPTKLKERLIAVDLNSVTPETIRKLKTIVSTDEAYGCRIKCTS